MALIQETQHRPWPLPRGPWVQHQTWSDMLFAHWPLDPTALRPHVPAPLEVDTFEGQAWVAITPYRMRNLRPRGIPVIPGFSHFAELDLRTYVRHRDQPGVYYFSLSAPNLLVVLGARLLYGLPYHPARARATQSGDAIQHAAMRGPRDAATGFHVTYRPVGDVFYTEPGTLAHWLTDRWTLFTVRRGGATRRVEIHRRPWRLQEATAKIHFNNVATAHGIQLPDQEPLLHFSRGVDVLIWPPKRS